MEDLDVLRGCSCVLRLFSHDGKVRILTFNSKCAFWITQCTHDRSTCVFWITHYTHEWPKMWFSFRKRGEEAWLCLGCLPIKHARVLFTFPLHVQRAICENRNWKTPLYRDLRCAFQITFCDVIWHTHGLFCVFWILIQNAHLELKFKIRTLPSCENSLRLSVCLSVHLHNQDLIKFIKAIYSIGGFQWILLNLVKSAAFLLQTSDNNLRRITLKCSLRVSN